MPPQETSHRPHKAVYWRNTGTTDRYNEKILEEAVELKVRWVGTRSNMLDPNGERIVVDASAIVDRTIPVGSQLWLGTLEDWLGTGSNGEESETEIMEVVAVEVTDDIKGRGGNTFREVGLKRFRGSRGRLETET